MQTRDCPPSCPALSFDAKYGKGAVVIFDGTISRESAISLMRANGYELNLHANNNECMFTMCHDNDRGYCFLQRSGTVERGR